MTTSLLDALLAPTVLAALVALVGVLMAPRISAAIKRRENGRVGAVALEVRKIDASQQLLDRLTAENDDIRDRLRELEARERALHDALVLVEAEMVALHARLKEINNAELGLHAVRVLEMVRRGRGVA